MIKVKKTQRGDLISKNVLDDPPRYLTLYSLCKFWIEHYHVTCCSFKYKIVAPAWSPAIVVHLPLAEHAGFQNFCREMNLRDSCQPRFWAMELGLPCESSLLQISNLTCLVYEQNIFYSAIGLYLLMQCTPRL